MPLTKAMIEKTKRAWARFREGYALTPEEWREKHECEEENRDNVEAIMGGYSAAGRKFRSPDIPGFVDRVRRGIEAVLEPRRPR